MFISINLHVTVIHNASFVTCMRRVVAIPVITISTRVDYMHDHTLTT